MDNTKSFEEIFRHVEAQAGDIRIDDQFVGELWNALNVETQIHVNLSPRTGAILQGVFLYGHLASLKSLSLDHYHFHARCEHCWVMVESFLCGHLSNLESLSLTYDQKISEECREYVLEIPFGALETSLECPKYVMSSISEAVEGHLSALNTLRVDGSSWKDEDMKSLLQCLIPRVSLKCLDLPAIGLGYGCAEVLGMNMQAGHLGNLEVLKILNHDFELDHSFRNGFKCLAKGLRSGCVKKLQHLSLGLDITGDGVDILSFAVREGIPPLSEQHHHERCLRIYSGQHIHHGHKAPTFQLGPKQE